MTQKEIVYAKDGEVFTDTMIVAEVFGKKHKNVLQRLREIESYIQAENIAEVKIIKSSYKDLNNSNRPKFILNRRAYTLLVMSFTGDKAMQFKMAYINAFDKMEAYIRENLTPSAPENNAVAVPQSPLEVLQIAINQMIEQQKRVDVIENKLAIIDKEREEAKKSVQAIIGDEETKKITYREKINILVGEIYKTNGISPHDIFNDLYDTFRNTYHADLKARYRINCERCDYLVTPHRYASILDLAEHEGYAESLYECLKSLVRMRKWC